LASQSQWGGNVLDDTLIKVALVDEHEALRRDQAEEDLV